MFRSIAASVRSLPRRWLALEPGPVFGGLFCLTLLAYVILIPVPRVDGQLIGSDGVGYYVYVRSFVLDGDLDFENEYTYYRDAFPTPELTPIGRPANKYSIGTAVLWLPFFLAAHALALLLQAVLPASIGGSLANGYNYLYQAAVCMGSIIYGALGFWLAYRCAGQVFAQRAGLLAVVLLWLASNAPYYMIFEPSMSHMVSLFSVALVVSLWFWHLRGAEMPGLPVAALLGAASGLVLLVRLQDGLFLLLPWGTLLLRLLQARQAGQAADMRRWFWFGLLAGGCMLLVFGLQLVAWQRIYGSWLALPYSQDHDPPFYWLQPNVVGVLISPFRGLFVWHPVYVLASVGLALLARRDWRLALALAGVLLLNMYVIAAWWSWWQGDAFGGRMFLNAMWAWVLGLTVLLDWLLGWLQRHPRLQTSALGLAGLLVAWNGLALVQYRLGLVPMGEPLTWGQVTIERLLVPWALLQRLIG